MKSISHALAIVFACLSLPATSAEHHPEPGVIAHLVVAEIDQEVIAEQYRHLQMEAFKARLDLQSARLKMRHASGLERPTLEQALTLQEERLEFLQHAAAETREELIHRVTERLELELEADHAHHASPHQTPPESAHSEFDGSWQGIDDEEAVMQLFIERDRARLTVEDEDVRFETEFEAQPRADGLWNVALRIIEGSEGEYEGKVSLGLAKLDGNHLVMALCEPGKDQRPTSLDDSEDIKVFRLSRR